MVIGKGMIAKEFKSYSADLDVIIFASGVSDSTNTEATAFDRELRLLEKTMRNNPGKLLVYFSTCSIYDPSTKESAYVRHKIMAEELIMNNHSPYLIFRLTNPIGKTGNTHTVVNYFINNMVDGHEFELWKNAGRNIIDIDDMFLLCNEIIQQRQFTDSVVNVANPENYPVHFIVDSIEKHFNVKGKYRLVEKGGAPVIDTTAVKPLFQKFNIKFDGNYLPDLLQKYFPKK